MASPIWADGSVHGALSLSVRISDDARHPYRVFEGDKSDVTVAYLEARSLVAMKR